MITISFPDGSVREYASSITPLQVAESISSRLAQEILCASVKESKVESRKSKDEWRIVELNQPIEEDAATKLH